MFVCGCLLPTHTICYTLVSRFVRFIMQQTNFYFFLFHCDGISRHLVLGLNLTHKYCTRGKVFAMIFPFQWTLSWAFVQVYKVGCYFGSVAEKKNNTHIRTRNVSDKNYCWMMTALGFRISPASWPTNCVQVLCIKKTGFLEGWVYNCFQKVIWSLVSNVS